MTLSGIVIDLETTGLDPAADEILQVGITDLQGCELWCRYYKPAHTAEWAEAEAINGITPADVAGCPAAADDADSIQAIVDAAQRVCIYNAEFDAPFLAAVGVNFEGVELHDTLEDFAELYGEWSEEKGRYRRQKLELAVEHTGYVSGNGQAHDALEDCRRAAHVQRWCDEQRAATSDGRVTSRR